MNEVAKRSRLTWLAEPEGAGRGRARLQLEFSAGRWRSYPTPDVLIEAPPGAVGDAPQGIEVFFPFVSGVVATEAAASSHADTSEERDRVAEFQTRVSEALDLDVEASLGEARQLQSTRSRPLVRMLKALGRKSAASRNAFISHVRDATLDPRTLRTVMEGVGPRPSVVVLLYVPGSFPEATSAEPLRDLDLELIYRTTFPAAEGIAELTRIITPDVPLPEPAVLLQARRNAEARAALLTEFGALTAAQVAELSGSDAKNRSAIAGRWRREGRLVAVDHHGKTYYPGFQFDADGHPRPVVAEALEHLSASSVTPWQQALWFTTANGWLDGRRPVDVLDDDPGAIVAAAREVLREPVG